MSTSTWIIVGLAIGLVASVSAFRSSHGRVTDLGLGIAGAVGGGMLCGAFFVPEGAGLDPAQLLASALGAGATLVGFRAFFPRAAPG